MPAKSLRAWGGEALLRNGFRRKRLAAFVVQLRVGPNDRILDLGGSPSTWEGSGLEGQVTLLNLEPVGDLPAGMEYRQGDACDLSFLVDQAFDVVFSNSVIEHVGDPSRQMQMAHEVRRVGRSYWVQTPNRYFPLELHFLFPGFQFLPRVLQERVAMSWPFSFPKLLGIDPLGELANLRLVGYREMTAYFPEALVVREKVAGLTKSLIAMKTRA
jgi:SAM-dependent methyltransferase